MSNINNILHEIPEGKAIVINYYEKPIINHYILENTSQLPEQNNVSDIPDPNVSSQTNSSNSNMPNMSDAEYNVTITNDLDDPNEITAEINATLDYNSGIDRINQVINLTDVLTNSIANSLGNIEATEIYKLSLAEVLDKTQIMIYKDITDGEDKCHICNEAYTEFDICRCNNLCGHYFHQKCIDHWYSSNTKCPICQQHI